ncbi:MAG: carbamoyltransferase HypF [Candidatus Zixiibacteriota bacterium]
MSRVSTSKTNPPDEAGRTERWRVTISGRVQGVGFRPFVHRLATELKLAGTVCNSSEGVYVEVQGAPAQLEQFRCRLETDVPPLAEIDSLSVKSIEPDASRVFRIKPSRHSDCATVIVPPDAAICDDCKREVLDASDRRYRYPFTNCTNCGPRYSIIEGLPYDRHRTSMRHFTMCDRCREEYDDPSSRRFHAQPNACPDCGPQLTLLDAKNMKLAEGNSALGLTNQAITAGFIVALKGLGGYQLIVDARNDSAVRRLRSLKRRPHKPFAVMYPSTELVKQHCSVSPLEQKWLQSAVAPIILLQRLQKTEQPHLPCESVSPGQKTLGVMLPCTPLHLLILGDLGFPVVATSGNLNGEPICIDDNDAMGKLCGIADLFLVHDRAIVRQVDDSVIRLVHDRPVVLRLGRGLAPAVIALDDEATPALATGGHEKSAFAIMVGSNIILSQHIGDLDSPVSRDALAKNIDSLIPIYGIKPAAVVCDDHPDYVSSRIAELRDAHPVRVQHHLAHILSCVAEQRIECPVLGVAWDGTGLGDDATIWGGEFIEVTPSGYRRVAHLRPFRLPGGEKAVREPRRAAIGVLYEMFGESFALRLQPEVKNQFSSQEIRVLTQMLTRHVNCPVTTSAGRLFDALASLMGICHIASYDGQAATALENTCGSLKNVLPYEFSIMAGNPSVIDWQPMVESILAGMSERIDVATAAERVHVTLAEMIAAVVVQSGLRTVVLSGGCFQNALLLSICAKRLEREGIAVHWPHRIPINDGGLAVGQMAESIRRLGKGC